MEKLSWEALVLIAATYWAINVVYILPKIRTYRKIPILEWLHGGFIGNLFEYKRLCEDEGVPFTWFKVQLVILSLFTLLLIFLACT